MIGCLRTRVRKQPIIALYFEFETVLKFYNLEALDARCASIHLLKGKPRINCRRLNRCDFVCETMPHAKLFYHMMLRLGVK